jgi:hypothetical protein
VCHSLQIWCWRFAATNSTDANIPGTVMTHSVKYTGKLITVLHMVVNVGKTVVAVITTNSLRRSLPSHTPSVQY